jgi:hypothetical protein
MGRTKNDLIELITKKGEIVPADTRRGYYLVDTDDGATKTLSWPKPYACRFSEKITSAPRDTERVIT